jgi:hypothetical protein
MDILNFLFDNAQRCFTALRRSKTWWTSSSIKLFVALLCIWTIAGCAVSPRIEIHGFHYDTLNESKGVEILAYNYGDSWIKGPTRGSERNVRTRIVGYIPVGDYLYVKWKIKLTGEVLEERVDLRPLLPPDMRSQNVEFVIKEKILYIFLTDFKRVRPIDTPIVGPFNSQPFLTRQIFPQTKN